MLIDFEDKFSEFLTEYKRSNAIDDEELEEKAPNFYLEWLNTPKDWLSGMSPNSYFKAFDVAKLIEIFGKYMLSNITLPGVLLNNITDKKEQTYPLLLSLLKNYEGEKSDEIKTVIVRLFGEMDMPHPYRHYINIIAESNEISTFSEACAQELKNSGAEQLENVIAAYEAADNSYPSDCFLDILTDLPYDERTYNFALEKFLYSGNKKAFYASCLGKIGNDKALPYLEEALKSEDIAYFDYMSIKNALEELGGEVNIDRDFTGDKDYDSLINMGE
ncbi:MAG: hypothetical protein ACOX8Q_02860 [Christensenellales bacterium]|jgi:hypothetical protein